MNYSKQIRGFTLLELLIVIGILAILASVVVLVLNPAELLKQARDSQRVSDMASLKSAIGLYLASVSSPGIGVSANCYMYAIAAPAVNCAGRHASKTLAWDVDRITDGSGWIPINLDSIPGKSPLATLPIDPAHDITKDYFYSYLVNATDLTFELNGKLESTRYTVTEDLDAKDGSGAGWNAAYYEVGTAPIAD